MYEHELPSFCCFLLPASGTYTPISKSAKLSLQARNQDSWRLCRSPSQTPSQTIALRFLHCLLGGTMEWIFCCTYFSPLMVCLASWPDVFFFSCDFYCTRQTDHVARNDICMLARETSLSLAKPDTIRANDTLQLAHFYAWLFAQLFCCIWSIL